MALLTLREFGIRKLEQYETLLQAKPKPHVLDDYTVNRVTKAFTAQISDL